MENDEYLIYASRHGFNSGFVDHLFLARGSDGRWLYSTYHFCSSMVGVMNDKPPSSIAEFAKSYSARSSTGHLISACNTPGRWTTKAMLAVLTSKRCKLCRQSTDSWEYDGNASLRVKYDGGQAF